MLILLIKKKNLELQRNIKKKFGFTVEKVTLNIWRNEAIYVSKNAKNNLLEKNFHFQAE